MKNLLKPFGIIVLVAIIGFTMAGCATASSTGTSGPYGFFSGNGNASMLTAGAQVIASYTVIMGLFDTGYPTYLAAVRQAEASGMEVTSVVKSYGVFLKITAYAK
jgi:hypothetical protein